MKVVDNFLPEEYFNGLKNLILGNSFPWFLNKFPSEKGNSKDSYMTHAFYLEHKVNSDLYEHIPFLLEKINANAIIRVIANYYYKTKKIEVHPEHTDFPYKHKGAILSLNTCNGETRFPNNKKVKSKENRILFFDPSEPHFSTSTTNDKGRFNIIINYF